MRILEIFYISIRALRRNVMRTLLTMLGIIIGVGAVIAMVSIGNGAKAQIETQISSLGRNNIVIFSGNQRRGGFGMGFGQSPSLTKGDFEAIQREVEGVVAVSPEVRANAQIAAGNQNLQTSILGISADYPAIRSWPVVKGNCFSEQDVRSAGKVALIGKTTAKQLFGGENPVGQIIRIRNAPYTVVGLLSSKGTSMMGSDQDDIVMVPWTSAQMRLTGETAFRSFTMEAASPRMMPVVEKELTQLLRQRHRIQGDQDEDFMIRTQTQISDFATSTSRTMTALLGAIASVSLLVGGIGIMNIMLVSVTERTREIGLRMAVGAKGRDILSQFLIEAVTLSTLGGLLGILIGVGISKLLASKMNWPSLTSWDSVMMAFMFSAMVGIFFGFYPARKAARLDPIDALRYE